MEEVAEFLGIPVATPYMANAVVTAHNHVLRSWLRGEVPVEDAEVKFDRAMGHVLDLFNRGRFTGQRRR